MRKTSNKGPINPRTVNHKFGTGLRRLRKAAALSIVELAEKTDISRSNIHRLEAGEIAQPSVETLNVLARALKAEPEDLYDLAWEADAASTGLPSLPTYFRSKYKLNQQQIDSIQKTLDDIKLGQ